MEFYCLLDSNGFASFDSNGIFVITKLGGELKSKQISYTSIDSVAMDSIRYYDNYHDLNNLVSEDIKEIKLRNSLTNEQISYISNKHNYELVKGYRTIVPHNIHIIALSSSQRGRLFSFYEKNFLEIEYQTYQGYFSDVSINKRQYSEIVEYTDTSITLKAKSGIETIFIFKEIGFEIVVDLCLNRKVPNL